MRYSFLSAIALALGVASASAIGEYPTCAQACLISAAESAGCSVTDAECQCGSALDKITSAGTACLLKSTCSASDLVTVQSVAAAQCESVATMSGSASASVNASYISIVSSAVAGATSSGSSSSVSSATGIASGTGTKASSTTGTASSTGSATSSASTTAETGAASFAKAGGAMVGLGFLAMLAL